MTLKLLRGLDASKFNIAKSKLEEMSREQCKMSLTKWEMLLILQMSAKEIKTISQFITGENDPLTIDINSLFMLLILTSLNINLMEKIDRKLSFINNFSYRGP